MSTQPSPSLMIHGPHSMHPGHAPDKAMLVYWQVQVGFVATLQPGSGGGQHGHLSHCASVDSMTNSPDVASIPCRMTVTRTGAGGKAMSRHTRLTNKATTSIGSALLAAVSVARRKRRLHYDRELSADRNRGMR